MPLISVIIPAYNAEKTIRETIESVLNQTITDLELIVVDDGSQDATVEIVSKINDPRLRMTSAARSGVACSRNLGLLKSVGAYVSFLDADDIWTNDKLEAQLKALQANPEAAVAYSWTDRIDENNNFVRRGSYISVSGNVLAELLVINFIENGSNPLVRRDAAIAVGGFDQFLPSAQDWDFCLKLAARYQFVAVPAPQILYRLVLNSMSSNIFRLEAGVVKVIDRAFAQAPPALGHLKKYSLGNIYKYLVFKSFEGYPCWIKGVAAAKFLWHVIENDPEIWDTEVVQMILLNIAIVTFLPPKRVFALREQMKEETDITLIFHHFKTNFAQLI